ncbi:Serine hydrolase OS=Rhodanobacter lindaniclasticus OX=75310 GN=B1991_12105 PE=4 SV=1 [Rhodanobacter lindaniclasticus]
MVQRFLSMRPLSFRLAAGCALLMLATAVPAQSTAPQRLPPPVSTGDLVQPLLPVQLQDFDAYMADTLKAFEVPGIAVAIVKNGKVVMERGFGVKVLGKPDQVDARTLFAIASNTKAFTAAALQQLADAGKLDMDDRVIDHLPWFRMSDPYVTHEMRIRDLLAHRSGLSLGAGDLLYWPPTSYTTKEVVERLAKVPLKHGFRSHYAYDNILFRGGHPGDRGSSALCRLRAPAPVPAGGHGRIADRHDVPETRHGRGHRPRAVRVQGHQAGAADGLAQRPRRRRHLRQCARPGQVDERAAGRRGIAHRGRRRQAAARVSEKSHHEMWSMLTPIPIRKAAIPKLAPLTPDYCGYGEGWFLGQYQWAASWCGTPAAGPASCRA